MASKCIIIGCGIAGLASSIRLASKGMDVDVYESASEPGGKIHIRQIGDYRFDGGPSLFTQPEYVDELFQLNEKTRQHSLSYYQLDESCRYFWDDGTHFTAYYDKDRLQKEFADTFREQADAYFQYLRNSEWKYDKVGHIFLERSIHRLNSWLQKDVGSALLNLGGYGIFKSLHEWNTDYFSDPKLIQLFDRFATYNGSDPFRTSGMMSIIPHFEMNEGAYLPEKGIFDIIQSLYRLALDLGVTFHFSQKVDEVIIEDKAAKGIRVEGEKKPADYVISGIDINTAYRSLLRQVEMPKKIAKQEPSSSAIIFYWGIDRKFQRLGLHNILFSKNYKREFEALKNGRLYNDATVYINISSKHIPNDAPDYGENWFVMVNAPYDSGQDWPRLTEYCRQRVIEKVNKSLGVNIEEHIEAEDLWTPPAIEQQTSSRGGALYGSSSNSLMSAFNRHPNFHPDISSLYFCGGSVHPGGGIPLCLLSAKIAVEELLKDANS